MMIAAYEKKAWGDPGPLAPLVFVFFSQAKTLRSPLNVGRPAFAVGLRGPGQVAEAGVELGRETAADDPGNAKDARAEEGQGCRLGYGRRIGQTDEALVGSGLSVVLSMAV
jgi:hypothetical protein